MEPIHSYMPNSWKDHLSPIFNTEKMARLEVFIEQEEQNKAITYPNKNNMFNALKLTAYENVKIVILGQDPYHGEGQAHGLSFSVPQGVKIPPSLRNIYKELHSDLGYPIPPHGNLESWAKQGVLLLNSVLTVRAGEAGSHAGQGWETFTDEIIKKLNEKETPIVFMLWGSYAQKKGKIINKSNHFVLESVHPSPLSAHRGFFGCRHFSKANIFLKEQGIEPIDWRIT